jgi:hypothetical protein
MPERHLQSTIHLTGRAHRFEIIVRPCPDDQPSVELFEDYITARTHARALRRLNGWKIEDRVDAATRRKAEAVDAARIEARRYGKAG